MKWRSMRPHEAKRKVTEMTERNKTVFSLEEAGSSSYLEFRKKLLAAWADAKNIAARCTEANRRTYITDLSFAMSLYWLTISGDFEMSLRTAGDIGVWKYIAINIIPDIIAERFPKAESWADHMYCKTRRIYPLSLWWYIHLSWQGNREDTVKVLAANSTDSILNLVERSGKLGYRVDLYRNIMKEFAEHGHNSKLFRKVMVLNTAYSENVEPNLVPGGTEAYVKGLYDYFKEK